jgi:FlaA1/EpsC-like NDP-sugar epimerase/lipopolysaccharide/colanic/teichoic acid biosynthesis glycosyltransferase
MLNNFLKRTFDLVLSITGLLLFLPVFIFISLFIKIDSRGPVFFRQLRVGKDNRKFKIFKFRTMVQDAGKGPIVTANKDPRITRAGHLLRLTKLDEIPQLINVFLGSMSFVGPRPEIPSLVETYTQEFKNLLSVKPGITSPAAIYYRDEEEIVGTAQEIFEYHKNVLVPKKASFDLAYLQDKSFLYDIKLIILTLVSVLINKSGYMRDSVIKSRRFLIILSVILLSITSYYIAYLIRFDFSIPEFYLWKLFRTMPMVVMIKLTFFAFFGLFEGYWRYVGIADLINVLKVVFLSAVSILLIEYLFLSASYPTGVVFIDGVISFFLFSGQRLSLRLLREVYSPIRPLFRDRALIIGSGDRGESILRDIKRNPDLSLNVIGYIGNKDEKGIKIHQVPVLGDIEDLYEVVDKKDINTLIIAKEELSSRASGILTQVKSRSNCKILNVPAVSDYLTGKISSANRLGEVKIEDLLGRKSVKLDNNLIESIYKNKSILITGAGGSIGSELVRQIIRFSPSELFLLDKDETLLYEIETELKELDIKIPYKTLIGDIRNQKRIEEYFGLYKPRVVLHSAAYKHVPLLEGHPHDAFHNNVIGTRNLLGLAGAFNVERFVMISTDKAVRPTNVMGASKALAERLMFEHYAPPPSGEEPGVKFMAVRFGNVLGSRGSVIPLFRRQIERGGPIRITHEEITRYFMSIPESAQLVLQAGAMGKGGEIFILKMGDPVKIKDLAYRMIEFSGLIPEVDIQVEYTGLRPGEKMYEELLSELEGALTTEHEKILVINNKEAASDNGLLEKINALEKDLYSLSNSQIRQCLQDLVPDYTPQNPA